MVISPDIFEQIKMRNAKNIVGVNLKETVLVSN